MQARRECNKEGFKGLRGPEREELLAVRPGDAMCGTLLLLCFRNLIHVRISAYGSLQIYGQRGGGAFALAFAPEPSPVWGSALRSGGPVH